jgi:hypothetical protein
VLKTKMEAAMPNLTEKKEALELAKKENQTAQKDVEENARNIKHGKARGVDGGRWWCMDRSPKTLSQPCNLAGLHSLSVL